MSMPAFRSVFISDLHLGYKGADIRSVNAFLRSHDFEYLFLVGDILDGWKLEQRWYWSQEYSDFLDLLMDLRKKQVQTTLLTGNHDEKLRSRVARYYRPFLSRRFGIKLAEHVVHRTQDGRRLMVIHGDQFDSRMLRGVSKHADSLWSQLGEMSWKRPAIWAEGSNRQNRWSLGKAIATNAKSLIWSFGECALRRAEREGMDGIVCGHSHVPVLMQRGRHILANCGSWTGARHAGEHHTAIVEHLDGSLGMVKWPAMRYSEADPENQSLDPSQPNTRSVEAARLARLAYRLWAPERVDGQAGHPDSRAPGLRAAGVWQ